MPDLFFDSALLPAGWARNVRLGISDRGDLTSVEDDASPRGAERHGGVVIPGVPNLHSHAFQRGLAGLTERAGRDGDSFWTWRERMYAFLERLGPDDVGAIAAQLYVEMLRHGFTAVVEFHYLRNDPGGRPYADPVEMGRRVLAAAADARIGMTLLPALYRASDFGGAPPTETQRRFTASVEDLIGDVAVLGATTDGVEARVGLALHSLRAVPPRDLSVAVDACRGIDASAPIHIHVAEQQHEVEACLAWSGARPVEWLLDNTPVDPAWCLVHATHVDDREVARLVSTGAVVGLCPTTEANLGDGVFPLAELNGRRGVWGVGSDAQVSTSPAAELRLLEYGQRLGERRRNVAAGPTHRSTARSLLEAAWAGGAQASGRAVGSLERGARADLVVLDPDHPALAGREADELLDSWIFSGDSTPVRDVMVGGGWVVRDGRHARQDAIAQAYVDVARRIARETPQLAMDLEG